MPTQNDIPVAQRISDPNKSTEQQPTTANSILRSLQTVPWWGYSLAILAFMSPIVSTRIWFALNANAISQTQTVSVSNENGQVGVETQTPQTTTTTPVAPFVVATPSATPKTGNVNPANSSQTAEAPADLFGHHSYKEAPLNQLRTIGRAGDGYEIKLREAAAKNYLNMDAAAKAEGVDLVVISGFRTISEQQELFFEISKQRNQTPAQRAKVSAPPGHSEHHTGYAIDIGDGSVPSSNLSTSFEKTAAYQWLQNNAAKYGFEMSFPPNNPQGVMYEPWHWRFVGDDDSLSTFYKKQKNSGSFLKKT